MKLDMQALVEGEGGEFETANPLCGVGKPIGKLVAKPPIANAKITRKTEAAAAGESPIAGERRVGGVAVSASFAVIGRRSMPFLTRSGRNNLVPGVSARLQPKRVDAPV